ncbi:MAG: hypothetical protein WCI40_07120 [Verrucomicrobiota bacterium]
MRPVAVGAQDAELGDGVGIFGKPGRSGLLETCLKEIGTRLSPAAADDSR